MVELKNVAYAILFVLSFSFAEAMDSDFDEAISANRFQNLEIFLGYDVAEEKIEKKISRICSNFAAAFPGVEVKIYLDHELAGQAFKNPGLEFKQGGLLFSLKDALRYFCGINQLKLEILAERNSFLISTLPQ